MTRRVVKVRPELTLPELSGPSSPLAMSTPFTVKELTLKFAAKLPGFPPPPPPPPPLPPLGGPPPLSKLSAGTVPVTVRSVSVSPPAAAATFCSLATVLTEDELMAASVPPPVSVLLSILLPALGRVVDPIDCRNPNPNPLPFEPAVGALVTVMSVPTPYSECRTDDWAFLTPADAAVTVITRPIPKARPTAMKMA